MKVETTAEKYSSCDVSIICFSDEKMFTKSRSKKQHNDQAMQQ